MSTQASFVQRAQFAQEVRRRFVADAGRAMVELLPLVQDRLTALISEAAPAREMQTRRDVWTAYQSGRKYWFEGTLKAWQDALTPQPSSVPAYVPETGLELLGTDVVENKITASRLILGILEKVSTELNDLLVRIRYLEGPPDPDCQDILQPDVLILIIIEQWASAGLSREGWTLVSEAMLRLLAVRLEQAYVGANALLIKQGVLPVIELKDRVRRVAPAAMRLSAPATLAPAPESEKNRGSGRHDASTSSGLGSARGHDSAGASGAASTERHASTYGRTLAEETRMMTAATPLARARSRAQGVLGHLKRLITGSSGSSGGAEATHWQPPSPGLAAAIAVKSKAADLQTDINSVAFDDNNTADVARAVGELRQRTSELKNKAETKSEKATIEIVALMFQSILQEDRIPPGIRVWFARLQMPVLRVALAEPDFFGTLNHPARQLIDRMGSCVMGFDISGINGSALETEIKRVVQVIEQYPETGKRVYQLVYDEFQKFLGQFLTGKASTQKLVSVAQQVEEKETLTIQYTIEMRNMLKEMPVREEIRSFLFKIWADVLAVAAIRKGPQHAETLELKKTATDLVWAASAKPKRSDRARVIEDLPALLQRLRDGMTLLGMAQKTQETHLQSLRDILAEAFLSKTQAIPAEQIQAMAERLANLEDFVSDDSTEDLPLDAESIELLLGIDASMIDVVANGGSKPNNAMLAWAQELQLGDWFTLDHNGRVAQVQFAWRSDRKHLHLFASPDGRSYLLQAGRLAAYLQAGLLLPQEEEALTVRATRDALTKLEANPERLLS